ncbi:MAG: undecaprenyl/decaprenyl-phosphate alpha-N-acetylglucosaminyl 1-phosphate transferase [Xanthomonadales bacterium]|nr:undecaprenyl/decaprenyl-phosphate alpha-N-acetylglucosaminyl 1-phosphate transferase [Xanthomonadales bacterium]
MDKPDEQRKVHAQPVPPVGGIAWFFGLAAALLGSGLAGAGGLPLLLAVAALMLIGAIDDRFPLPGSLRFVIQAGVVLGLILASGFGLRDLGGLLGGNTLMLGLFAVPMTVFACVGVINATNMVDGMDGVAGGLLAILFAAIWLLAGERIEGSIALYAMVALIPFLAINVRLPWQPRARAFFGDAGSMSAGLLVAWLLVSATQGEDRAFAPVTALYLFALPLIDTVSIMLRRMAEGRSPFTPDQNHIHHLLCRLGLNVPQTWSVMMVAALLLAVLGVGLERLGVAEWQRAALFLGIALVYHRSVVNGLRAGRLWGRPLTALLVRA